jgi:hypothetical protein
VYGHPEVTAKTARFLFGFAAGFEFISAGNQNLGLDLEEIGLNRGGTADAPQQGCKPEHELALYGRSRIVIRDNGCFECVVILNVFQSDDDSFGRQSMSDCVLPRSPLAFLGSRPGATQRIASISLELPKRSHELAIPSGILNGVSRFCAWIQARAGSILRWDVRSFGSLRLRDPLRCWGKLAVGPRVLPEPQRHWNRIDVELLPPRGLVTTAMELAVMEPADRHGKLVTDSVSKRSRLRKREVMRIRWRSPAHKARLPRHELSMLLIAQANRFAQRTDCATARPLPGHCRSPQTSARTGLTGRYYALTGPGVGLAACDLVIHDCGESSLKLLFDNLSIVCCQGVLGGKILVCPRGRLIRRIDICHLSDQALSKGCRLVGWQSRFC